MEMKLRKQSDFTGKKMEEATWSRSFEKDWTAE